VYQSHYEHVGGCRLRSADLAQLAESSEAPRHRSFDVRPHRQVCVNVNAAITDGPRRSDWDATIGISQRWQLRLTPICCTSDGLEFNVSMFDLVQFAMSPAQSEIFAESASTTAGEHEP